MRSGKMMESIRETLKNLLNELKSPRNALQICNFYKVGYWFRNENDADNFRSLLLFNLGFDEVRVESHATYRRTPGYIIYVTWHVSEQEDLIKNIERYLQEDNMGLTNVNRENTKFYAIVTDAEGKKTAYEITHSSLETGMEWGCDGCHTNYTLRFEKEDMVKRDSGFAEYVKLSDEVDKLRAENEKLKARLGKCEDQLRSACEFLNGYGDVDIDPKEELLNLDAFDSSIDYKVRGEIKKRWFGKRVASEVKRHAEMVSGVWRKTLTIAQAEENEKILEQSVDRAINGVYLSTEEIKAEKDNHFYIQNPAFDASALCKSIQLSLNSWYGLTSAAYSNTTKCTPIFNAYDSIKDVKFANPATIVFWKDGTKTVVKAQGDEQYVPEVGLAMCICKKVTGNTRDYYRVFLHWLKKVKED